MSGVVSQLGWTLLHFVWQGALVACAAALGLLALRNSWPQARYALACAALFVCVAWPATELVLRLQSGTDGTAAAAVAFKAGAGVGHAAGALGWLQSHLPMIVLGWAACAAALSLRMVLGLWWISRAARGRQVGVEWQARIAAMALRFGITRSVRVRVADSIASPITAGWWRPLIVLPSSLLTGMPADLLEALIAHELGHVKRFDYLVNLLQNIAEMLLFYHPAVWWLSHRIRTERERIADDLAAAHVGRRHLALALSELEKIQFSRNDLALAANGGDLMSRIKRLLRPPQQQPSWKAALPVLGLSLALVAGCAQLPAKQEAVHTRAMANFKSCAKPVWPAQSLRDENTGTVVLGFLIDTDGKVLDSRLENSSGYPPLDEAARTGISKCTFIPATSDGVPVREWMKMQYVWTLK